jgi:hypothetical protein
MVGKDIVLFEDPHTKGETDKKMIMIVFQWLQRLFAFDRSVPRRN